MKKKKKIDFNPKIDFQPSPSLPMSFLFVLILFCAVVETAPDLQPVYSPLCDLGSFAGSWQRHSYVPDANCTFVDFVKLLTTRRTFPSCLRNFKILFLGDSQERCACAGAALCATPLADAHLYRNMVRELCFRVHSGRGLLAQISFRNGSYVCGKADERPNRPLAHHFSRCSITADDAALQMINFFHFGVLPSSKLVYKHLTCEKVCWVAPCLVDCFPRSLTHCPSVWSASWRPLFWRRSAATRQTL